MQRGAAVSVVGQLKIRRLPMMIAVAIVGVRARVLEGPCPTKDRLRQQCAI